MKRLLLILLAIAITISSASIISSAEDVEIEFNSISRLRLGDLNADDLVSALDVTEFKNMLCGNKMMANGSAADMNYDNDISVADLLRLKKQTRGIEISSIFQEEIDALYDEVMNSADVYPSTVTGTKYYFSASSSGGNGTQNNPYAFSKLSSLNLQWGDAVLFKRGDTFRGKITTKNGVYYGAYGTGAKPNIYGSATNYAHSSWSTSGSLYTTSVTDSGIDVGLVYLDGVVAVKKTSTGAVTSDYDYYYDSSAKRIYIKLPKHPNNYSQIEMGQNSDIVLMPPANSIAGVSAPQNVIVENLCLKYTSGHGISIKHGSSNIIVRNCEISYCGGGYLSGNVRYGNGIEVWRGAEQITLEKNYVHDIYDSGLTHQGSGNYAVKNINFNYNLIERCGMGSIEYWLAFADEDGNGTLEGQCSGQYINYKHNIMRYAGYGFGGEQRPNKTDVAHIRSDMTCPNWMLDYGKSFQITDNIFEVSAGSVVLIAGTYDTDPVLRNNVYAQILDNKLGTYKYEDIDTYTLTDYDFDFFVDSTIRKNLDRTAKVYWY